MDLGLAQLRRTVADDAGSASESRVVAVSGKAPAGSGVGLSCHKPCCPAPTVTRPTHVFHRTGYDNAGEVSGNPILDTCQPEVVHARFTPAASVSPFLLSIDAREWRLYGSDPGLYVEHMVKANPALSDMLISHTVWCTCKEKRTSA